MNRSAGNRSPRSGWLLMELCLAMALLLILVYAFTEVSIRIHDSLALARQQLVAQECLEQVADELFVAQTDSLGEEQLTAWPLPAWAEPHLPNGQLMIRMRPDLATASDAIVMTLTVRWQHGPPRTMETTVFRFPESTPEERES